MTLDECLVSHVGDASDGIAPDADEWRSAMRALRFALATAGEEPPPYGLHWHRPDGSIHLETLSRSRITVIVVLDGTDSSRTTVRLEIPSSWAEDPEASILTDDVPAIAVAKALGNAEAVMERIGSGTGPIMDAPMRRRMLGRALALHEALDFGHDRITIHHPTPWSRARLLRDGTEDGDVPPSDFDATPGWIEAWLRSSFDEDMTLTFGHGIANVAPEHFDPVERMRLVAEWRRSLPDPRDGGTDA